MGLALLEKENRGMLVLDTLYIYFSVRTTLTAISFTSNVIRPIGARKSRRLTVTVQSVRIYIY